MSPLKRVLLFAPYFLPRRRVGSMRPFRFAIHLREFGWEPTVLTIAPHGQSLTEREERLLRQVRVLNITSPIDRTFRSESQLGTGSGNRNQPWGPFARLARAADRRFPVDTWLPLLAAKYGAICRHVAGIDPHVIYATGDPWSALVTGRWLSRRFGKPYVADFRDPWTLSVLHAERRGGVAKWLEKGAERRVIRQAGMVMFQAEQTAEAYRKHYTRLDPATVVIRNSFDPDLFEDPVAINGQVNPDRSSTALLDKNDLQIGFFGRFRVTAPAAPLVDVLAEMRRRYGNRAERVFIHSFGPLSASDAAYARNRNVTGQFVQHEPVPIERSLSVLRQFDLLLVSNNPRRKYVIPAKLFEYLATGRPILSLSPNPEVADIIRRTGTGVEGENPVKTARLLAECVEALDRGEALPIPFDPKPEEIMRHDARTATRELARILDALANG